MAKTWLAAVAMMFACSADNPAFDPIEGGGGSADSGTATTGGPPATSANDTTAGPVTTGEDGPDPTVGGSEEGSTGPPPSCLDEIGDPCDAYDPLGCPQGFKCSPLASPDAVPHCVPIEGDGQLGDPCSLSCEQTQDTCGPGNVCLTNNTGEEVCIRMCVGQPPCPDAGLTCIDFGAGLFGLCLLACDPLDPMSCPPDALCMLFEEAFACVDDQTGKGGQPGDPCESLDECDFGLACVPAPNLPGCAGAACCSPYCDLGSGICPPGLECLGFSRAQDIQPNLGVCGVAG